MDFKDILDETSHRPWPVPSSPWIMTQSWHDLLFAHWPIEEAAIRAAVPSAFELDLFDGQAWIAVVPFRMSNVSPRGVPAMPWVSAFPELNVRTYTKVGDKPGVYFFSLDAGNPIAVTVARKLVHLPYHSAVIRMTERDGWISYDSRRTGTTGPAADLVARYRPTGEAAAPKPGTLEYFLTERYCLYTTDPSGTPYRLEIHHPPWQLQPAELEVSVNTMAQAAGFDLPASSPLLHFSRRQDAVAWRLVPIAR
jgi:uncharacterized protein YqjF (DUF2071 family)